MCFKRKKLIKPLRKWGDDYIFTMGDFDFTCDKYDITFLSNGQLYSARMTWGEYNDREENFELLKFILTNIDKIEEKYNFKIRVLGLLESDIDRILKSDNINSHRENYGYTKMFDKVSIEVSLPQYKEKYEEECIEKVTKQLEERIKRMTKFENNLKSILK